MAITQKITPNLWFDTQAEEAATFYTSVFDNSKINNVTHYGKEGFEVHGMPEGTVLTVDFRLEGQDFTALNGGPQFKFNEAVSFVVTCETQEEIDHYWHKLSAVPEAEACGWLKDKFGVSWQVVPEGMNELLQGEDKAKAGRAMKAMLQMKKIDIATLKQA